jgi:hypothetical protein
LSPHEIGFADAVYFAPPTSFSEDRSYKIAVIASSDVVIEFLADNFTIAAFYHFGIDTLVDV